MQVKLTVPILNHLSKALLQEPLTYLACTPYFRIYYYREKTILHYLIHTSHCDKDNSDL